MRKLKFNINRKYGICLCVFALIISQAGINNHPIHSENINLNIKQIKSEPLVKFISSYRRIIVPETVTKKESGAELFVVTAYSLSLADCGKSKTNPAYGISRSGDSLKGKTWRESRSISVDPNIIPLGTHVKIEFIDEKYEKYSGNYISNDTGLAIKGNKIDFFLGANATYEELKEFGVTKAFVTILADES